ncbi:hypothetical protein [Arthrobacter sp. UYEF36]|uniref:hypothetical protein n=1 Tax=Arthrobacter sp. UYEF36 TaxID=1756366 RepID=UPI0033947873
MEPDFHRCTDEVEPVVVAGFQCGPFRVAHLPAVFGEAVRLRNFGDVDADHGVAALLQQESGNCVDDFPRFGQSRVRTYSVAP